LVLSHGADREAPPFVRSYAAPVAPPSLAVAWQRLPWKQEPIHALTDAGRPIPLYALAADSAKLQRLVTRAAQLDEDVRQEFAPTDGMIRTAEADPGSDCHGWLFTGGRHLIDGQDVEWILQDNGYQHVLEPQPGDLAIYPDSAGKIRHSGVVVAVTDKHVPLVESKWGFIGRYISPAFNHMYGPGCRFYRSSREGHHLRLSTEERSTATTQ
jgi:hypothetical protein